MEEITETPGLDPQMGEIAKAHFKNRYKVTEELRTLVSRQTNYDLVFPAAALYMARLDGELSSKERELYRAMHRGCRSQNIRRPSFRDW